MKQKQNCKKFNKDFKNGSHQKNVLKKLVKKIKTISADFPGGSLEDSTLPMQGAWV